MANYMQLLSFGDSGWGDELARGVLVTVTLALATLPLGLLIGFLIAVAKNSSEPLLRNAANVYTTIFRGLPELLTLFLIYYGGQMALSALWRLLFGHAFEDLCRRGAPVEDEYRRFGVPPGRIAEELVDRFPVALRSIPEFAFGDEDVAPVLPEQDVGLAARVERLARSPAFEVAVELDEEMVTQGFFPHV